MYKWTIMKDLKMGLYDPERRSEQFLIINAWHNQAKENNRWPNMYGIHVTSKIDLVLV